MRSKWRFFKEAPSIMANALDLSASKAPFRPPFSLWLPSMQQPPKTFQDVPCIWSCRLAYSTLPWWLVVGRIFGFLNLLAGSNLGFASWSAPIATEIRFFGGVQKMSQSTVFDGYVDSRKKSNVRKGEDITLIETRLQSSGCWCGQTLCPSG